MDKWLNELIVTFIATVLTLATWFVRTVMTNARRIDILEKEAAERDKRRVEDREMMIEMRKEIREELKELRSEVHRLSR